MCDTIRYLDLRARGHTKIPQFRNSLKSVKQLLENHATKPAINQPCEFSGEPRATFLVDFSPNKRWAASSHGDHTVRVTDILTGKCTHILTGHPRTPWCLAFNPASDDILASGCLGGEVRIWDLHGGGSEVLQNPNEGQVITSLAFSPSGDAVVFATLNKIYFWAWTRSKPFALTQTKYEFERVRWLRFDPFGRYLYTGIANNSSGRRMSAEPPPAHSGPERLDPRSENERTVNRRRYNEVIRRIIDHQYTHGHQVPNSSQSYLDMSRPRSPVNEERLTLARQYARHVTALTSGPGSVYSVSGATAPRSLYSNSSAGTWDTVLAPALPSRYQDLRPENGTWDANGNLPQSSSSSASAATSSGSTHQYRQERRNRWGRYRPAFFSLSSDDRSSENNDRNLVSGENIQNNTSSDEDDEPLTQSFRDRERRLYNGLSSPQHPRFHPFSVRREVSLGDGLETDEFEILPVDQGGGSETSFPEMSSFQEENNRINERTAGTSLESTESDINSLRWNDLRSLWMRCCNNHNSGDGVGASSGEGPSTSQTGISMSAGQDHSDPTTRTTPSLRPLTSRHDRNVNTTNNARLLLNSDPFMGYAERNVEFLNISSSRSSTSSTGERQSLARINQSALFPETEDIRAGKNREVRNSSDQHSCENASQSRLLESSEPNLVSNESLDEPHPPNIRDQGISTTSAQQHCNLRKGGSAGASSFKNLEESSILIGKSPVKTDKSDGQERGSNTGSVGSKNNDIEEEGTASSASQSHSEMEPTAGPSGYKAKTKRKSPHTMESMASEHLLRCKSKKVRFNIDPELNEGKYESIETHKTSSPTPANEEGASNCPNELSSDLMTTSPAHSLSVPDEPLSTEVAALIDSAQPATGKEQSQINTPLSIPTHSDNLNVISTPESSSFSSCTPSSSNTCSDALPRENMSATTASPVLNNPQVIAMIASFANSKSETHVKDSNQESSASLPSTSSDVTATLTQALAAVHCSRPSVSSSGHHSRRGNNPFCSVESPALASVTLSTSSSLSTSDFSAAAATSSLSSPVVYTPFMAQSHRGAALRRLYSSNLPSAFTACSTSGQYNATSTSTAHRISSAVFPHVSVPTSFSSSQFSRAHTISSPSYSIFSNQSRSDGTTVTSTSAGTTPRQSHPWLSSLFGRRRQGLGVAHTPSQSSTVPIESDTTQRRPEYSLLNMDSVDVETTEDSSSDSPHQLDMPLVERLESLSRSMGQRLQNLSRTVGRRASQLSQLQHRISVLEETYNRRMRFLHREYENRLASSSLRRRLLNDRSRFLRREFLHRHGALLGHPHSQSSVSEVQSSIASELRQDQIQQRAAFSGSLRLRVRRGGLLARSRQHPVTRGLLNLGSHASETGHEENSTSNPPWFDPVHLEQSHTGASRNRRFGISRPGMIPPAPAPGSLGSLHLFGEDNQDDSEDEQEGGERAATGPMSDDRHQEQAEHLHPDYQRSILGDGLSRHDDPLHYMMNNTIAGTFWTRDEHALASNFIPQTHRIQRWSVLTDMVPDISDSLANIVVRNCKLHNDASCSLSRDGKLLAAFVPTHRGFPDKMVLGIFSLESGNFAQCLYTKSFGPNAISVSISPENSYVLVGTAARRMFFFSANQMVGQVYKMVKQKAGESSMRHTTDLFYYPENRTGFCSVNSACWLPEVGMGLVFGTNKGDLVFSRPGSKRKVEREPYFWRSSRSREASAPRGILDFFPRRRIFTEFSGASSSNTNMNSNPDNNPLAPTTSTSTLSSRDRSSWRSSATQTTTVNDHRSAATQTRSEEEDEEEVAEVAI